MKLSLIAAAAIITATPALATPSALFASTRMETHDNEEWVEIADLSRADSETLATDPESLRGRVPDELITIGRDEWMLSSFNRLRNAVLSAGDTPDLQAFLDSTISVSAYRQGTTIFVWVAGDADERGESSYQVRIEFDVPTQSITMWSDLEFVDHP